jgi:hypothetical protein
VGTKRAWPRDGEEGGLNQTPGSGGERTGDGRRHPLTALISGGRVGASAVVLAARKEHRRRWPVQIGVRTEEAETELDIAAAS